MRRLPLLVPLFLIPSVAAEPLLTDPAGDVDLLYQHPTNLEPPENLGDSVDLIAIWVSAEDRNISFTVQVVNLENTQSIGLLPTAELVYYADFTILPTGAAMQIRVRFANGEWQAGLVRLESGSDLGVLDVYPQAPGNITVVVPREQVHALFHNQSFRVDGVVGVAYVPFPNNWADRIDSPGAAFSLPEPASPIVTPPSVTPEASQEASWPASLVLLALVVVVSFASRVPPRKFD